MDEDLVTRAQQGDQGAFERIVADAHPRLFRVAVGVLGDAASAEDATQQALVAIWRDLPRLRDPGRFDAWSYRLLVRACYAEVRRRPGSTQESAITSATEPTAADAFSGVIAREQLAHAFPRLSVEHRTIIVLRYMYDWPIEQVAEALDVPPGTVSSRLSRALAALRAILEADERRPVTRAEGTAR